MIPSLIDSVVRISDTEVYFFHHDQYIRYSLTDNQAADGYPKSIATHWHGINFAQIDAVYNKGNGKIYFFSGDQYSRYDINKHKVDAGYPKSIKKYWPTLKLPYIDAVFNSNDGYAYFFSGNQYIKYDIKKGKADSGYPKALNDGFKALEFDTIDAAFSDERGFAYLFSGAHFSKWHIEKAQPEANYPRLIDQYTWPGVVFASQSASDIIYTGLQNNNSVIDAAFADSQDKIFFFSDNKYLQYDNKTDGTHVSARYPLDIQAHWPKLPFDKIDAVYKKDDKKCYFFSGQSYARYDLEKK